MIFGLKIQKSETFRLQSFGVSTKTINHFGFSIRSENICGRSLTVKVLHLRDISARSGENNNWLQSYIEITRAHINCSSTKFFLLQTVFILSKIDFRCF